MIWQIASATGWSRHHILWRVNYPTLSLMLKDAPHYVKVGKDRTGKKKAGKSAASFFQSMQKQRDVQ